VGRVKEMRVPCPGMLDDDGSTQVTYKGQPLYYYAHEGPGEVTCHNVDEFGGLWLAVNADGNSV
jgi:predicted lipoprotein with Yx(FWY)xxD motif